MNDVLELPPLKPLFMDHPLTIMRCADNSTFVILTSTPQQLLGARCRYVVRKISDFPMIHVENRVPIVMRLASELGKLSTVAMIVQFYKNNMEMQTFGVALTIIVCGNYRFAGVAFVLLALACSFNVPEL